jgi:E3 ubiquitin-protein ligase CHFR
MITPASVSLLSPPLSGLKRRASEDAIVESNRKRLKEDTDDRGLTGALGDSPLVQELADELQCGCCAALVYKPVLVLPCQHFFCGRYASTYRY